MAKKFYCYQSDGRCRGIIRSMKNTRFPPCSTTISFSNDPLNVLLEERDFVIFDFKKWCGIIREKEEEKRYRSINGEEIGVLLNTCS